MIVLHIEKLNNHRLKRLHSLQDRLHTLICSQKFVILRHSIAVKINKTVQSSGSFLKQKMCKKTYTDILK